MDSRFLCENVGEQEGHLLFAEQDTTALAKKYGTPLYLMDEQRIRERCRSFKAAAEKAFSKAHIMFASKAASFKRIYEIMREEGMCIDVVSCGEIATAKKAEFPLENAFFHSSNKTDNDVCYAMENGVGFFVIDNEEELLSVDMEAKKRGITQNILIRITPGIDPHTFEAVATGKVDSKFGFPIITGQAEEIVRLALSLDSVSLCGFHCHIGSQVFDSDVFLQGADVMLDFIADIRDKLGYTAKMLDLGGGFGVRYLPTDPELDIEKVICEIGDVVKNKLAQLNLPKIEIGFEPGRSIVADAGMTLYTVGNVKKIPEFINYVSVDGGMSDNIRFALYGSPYTLIAANRVNESCDMECSVVGRCCESGDVIQNNVMLPSSIKRGDTLAVLTTGAYNYSMASNYNRIPRPPVVMLNGKDSYIAVRRETYDDIVNLDV